MREDLRERREQHLMLVRMGIPFKQRCRRLAEQYDVSMNAVEKDDTRMDEWMDDIVSTASFQKKASFLLHQHRSQSEALEQLARNANQQRQEAMERAEELEDELQEVRRRGPETFQDFASYIREVRQLASEANQADQDIFKWQREERQERSEITDNVEDEFEMRQSLGEIEQVPDELHVQSEHQVTERKVIAGLDLNELPGLNRANIIGANLDSEDVADEEEREGMADIPLDAEGDDE